MLPRRVFLLLAVLLIPLALVVALCNSAKAASSLPALTQKPPLAQAPTAPAIQRTLPFSEVAQLATSAAFPDVMVAISQTNDENGWSDLHGAIWSNGVSWREWGSRPCIADDFVDPYSTSPSLVSVGSGQLWARCKDSREWHYSPDAGDTWRPMGAEDAHLLVADAGNPGHALMVNDNGLWRSVNGGAWQLVSADFSAPPPVYYLPLALRQ